MIDNKSKKSTTSKSETDDFILADEENNNLVECNMNEKKTRNRQSKAERFSEKREELVKELEKKMGLTEEVRGILLYTQEI